MTKDKALDLALDALESCMYPQQKQFRAITAIKQARALDKKAENARELGLDYEPVWCGHCNGSGRMVRDPDIGTDQKCFVCDGAGVPAAPVQDIGVEQDERVFARIEARKNRDAAAVKEHSLNDVRCQCCGYMTYHREHMGCIRAAAAAPMQDDLPDFIAGAFGVSRGTAYDMMREALKAAAPVQEPVAWRWKREGGEWQLVHQQPRSPTAQPLYTTPPAAQPAPVQDKGPWIAGVVQGQPKRVYIQSEDFKHDVRLYVDGDFASDGQRFEYAEQMAQQFNATPLAQPAPVQEPMAWVDVDENGTMYSLRYWSEPDNRNEVALYRAPPNVATPLAAPVQEPVAWIDCKVQMPPPGVRVFFLHKDYDRVGFDTWCGDDFRWTPSHWMPIPPLTTTPPAAQPASQSDGTGGCAMCGAAYEDQVVKAAQPAYEYASEADASESIRVSELPEPLRLADMLDKTMQWPLHGKAADCLRQMYAEQRQPLTDEQIKQIYTEQTGSFIDDSPWALLDFARAIEAAHGITGETKWTNNN